MRLELRTVSSAYYGTGHYLCIDTDAHTYTTHAETWISKEVPVIQKKALTAIIRQCINAGYKEV